VESTAHVPLESHCAVALGNEHVVPVRAVVLQVLLEQLAIEHGFVGVGQSEAATQATHRPAPTQCGALAGHAEVFSA